jgi:hypothetical protein
MSLKWLYKIPRKWVDVLVFYVFLFGVVYLAWWGFAMEPTKEKRQILYKSRKKCDGDFGNI